jgi:hypothetical protein
MTWEQAYDMIDQLVDAEEAILEDDRGAQATLDWYYVQLRHAERELDRDFLREGSNHYDACAALNTAYDVKTRCN